MLLLQHISSKATPSHEERHMIRSRSVHNMWAMIQAMQAMVNPLNQQTDQACCPGNRDDVLQARHPRHSVARSQHCSACQPQLSAQNVYHIPSGLAVKERCMHAPHVNTPKAITWSAACPAACTGSTHACRHICAQDGSYYIHHALPSVLRLSNSVHSLLL
jgi:hypothetical protein